VNTHSVARSLSIDSSRSTVPGVVRALGKDGVAFPLSLHEPARVSVRSPLPMNLPAGAPVSKPAFGNRRPKKPVWKPALRPRSSRAQGAKHFGAISPRPSPRGGEREARGGHGLKPTRGAAFLRVEANPEVIAKCEGGDCHSGAAGKERDHGTATEQRDMLYGGSNSHYGSATPRRVRASNKQGWRSVAKGEIERRVLVSNVAI
jgi:hypothetical protein